MSDRAVGIVGLGAYLPEQVRTNAFWPESVVAQWEERMARIRPDEPAVSTEGVRRILEAIRAYGKDPFVGARERRVMAEGELSSDMEAHAARHALENAGLKPCDIDLILSHTLVPDYLTVNASSIVHHKVGLRREVMAMTTDAMCVSFLMQFSLARYYIAIGEAKKVLVTQSSAASRIISNEQPFCTQVGDGASAAVMGLVEPGLGLLSTAFRTDGSLHGGFVSSVPGKRWYEEGRVVATSEDRAAAKRMQLLSIDMAIEVIDEALDKASIPKAEVRFFTTHQPSGWFRRVCQQAAGLEHAGFVDTFPTLGSLSAANIPMQLHLGQKEGLLHKGDPVVAFTLASGMNVGAAVFRWAL